MGPEHNFVSVCLPETLPDRLELVAYIMEMAFLIDDMIDSAESPVAAAVPYMADLLHAYKVVMAAAEGVDDDDADADSSSCSPAARIAIGFGREMVSVDCEGAKQAFEWLGKWARLMLSRSGGEKEFGNFDEYLKYRRLNVTSQYVATFFFLSFHRPLYFTFTPVPPLTWLVDSAAFGLFMFAMGLSIPEDQQQTCLDLSESFWLQTALANDYHSWEREEKAAADHNQSFVTNAIWVLMNNHSMTCEEARRVCHERAKQYATECVRVIEAVRNRDELCRDAKWLLEVQMFGVSGNAVWSLQCPRYHPDRTLNPAQLAMMRAIWAKGTTGHDHDLPEAANGTVEPSQGAVNRVVADRVVANEGVANGTAAQGATGKDTTAMRDVPALGDEVGSSGLITTIKLLTSEAGP